MLVFGITGKPVRKLCANRMWQWRTERAPEKFDNMRYDLRREVGRQRRSRWTAGFWYDTGDGFTGLAEMRAYLYVSPLTILITTR